MPDHYVILGTKGLRTFLKKFLWSLLLFKLTSISIYLHMYSYFSIFDFLLEEKYKCKKLIR